MEGIMEQNKVPTPEDVKQIYKYTYLLYEQYKDSQTEQDFISLRDATIELEKKYPFEYMQKMLIGITEVIEAQWQVRNKIGGK
jgi:hypothetical protein